MIIGSITNLELFSVFLVIFDIRVLLSILSFVGIYALLDMESNYDVDYYQHLTLKLIVFLSCISAVVTIFQFYFLGFNMNVRLMGMFTNSQMNGYIMLASLVTLYTGWSVYSLFSRTQVVFLSSIIIIAIFLSGTRTALFGCILFFVLIITISLIKNIAREKRLAIYFCSLFFLALVVYISLNFVSDVSGRGDVLDQSHGGRISVLIGLYNSLLNDGMIPLLFGKGLGYGSSPFISMYYESGMNPFYLWTDGTIQYFLLRQGLVGLVILFLLTTFFLFTCIKIGRLAVVIFLLVILTMLSTNVLEVYLFQVILAFNLFCLKYSNSIKGC
ncbi:hypothetical protein [Vibrio ezurae]|uniref:Uncharacterized protein n=1 Tax=Vibrio ezurae NBRC 102218 TaxID=1219080 RepID=U3CEE2_9VIBR|nr:hypothetical protein [Vibrio ezurae]GAD79634.1 hypothetical protein VEZ01S_19_00490 [Vibrio ezurae NBRC 102218]